MDVGASSLGLAMAVREYAPPFQELRSPNKAIRPEVGVFAAVRPIDIQAGIRREIVRCGLNLGFEEGL